VLPELSGDSEFILVERKMDGRKVQGRCRRMWIDDKKLYSTRRL